MTEYIDAIKQKLSPLAKAGLVVTMLLLLAGGTWFYRVQERIMRDKVEWDLTAIGRLKAEQISAWYTDQIKDAASIVETPYIRTHLVRFFRTGEEESSDTLHETLSHVAQQHDLSNILLVNTEGDQLFSLPGPVHQKGEYAKALRAALQQAKPMFTDIHAGANELEPHLSVVAPVYAAESQRDIPLGALVCVCRARDFLYPLLRFWPTPSKTSDTQLVRRDGDHVLFLNDLRKIPHSALKLRVPLSRADVPAVMAVSHKTGFVTGTDYQGDKVVAVILPVKNSPWFIVAKVDSAEVFAEWRFRSILLLALLLGLFALAGAIALAFRQREKQVHYRALFLSEAELRANVEQHSITLQAVGDGVIAANAQGMVELLNPAAEALTGWSSADALDKPLEDVFHIIHEKTRERIPNPVQKVMSQGEVISLSEHTLLIARDGTERPIADSGAPIRNRAGEITGVVLVFRDQSAERAAQQALQESEERFRLTFEQAAVGIAHVSPEGRWLRVNQRLCQIVGYTREELLKKTFQDITLPDDLDADLAYMEQLVSGAIPSYSLEKRYLRKDGTAVWINLTVALVCRPSGEPDYFISVMEDISKRKLAEQERESLQEQLLRAQRIEAVGRLAGGVAHDYNNMLSVIVGSAELALEQVPADHLLHGHLMEILTAAKRSIKITRQLLAFARKQTIRPQVLDLNETVEGMLTMLRRLIGEDIELAWLPADNPGMVNIDPSQVDQILANLCLNARDAIDGVGKITIETGTEYFNEDDSTGRVGVCPGAYVMLSVSDTGCGMDDDTMDNIFEPFFTTKDVHMGTGLGLATVYGIVKQNQGFINVSSRPGRGSRFIIYLPRHSGGMAFEVEPRRAKTPMSRGETVLFVEDEASILKLGKMILAELGYHVIAAEVPSRAIALADAHAGKIDLLITDVVMPEMNGRELAQQIQAMHPGIKVLFMSGYTADVIANRGGVLDKSVHFIQKPFYIHTLAEKVREVLD